MELQSKLLEQMVSDAILKIEEHMLIVMQKSSHEEHLSQPLQINNKQYKIAVTFLTDYNGIFDATDKNNKFYFANMISDEVGFMRLTIPPGAYEPEGYNKIKRIIIDEEHLTEATDPFTIKPNFSTRGSIVAISEQGPLISILLDDSIRNLLGFNASAIYEEYILSPNPVDISSFDKIILECDTTQGMIFEGRRSVIKFNWTMKVDPGFKNIEKISGGISWYMMGSKDINSSICFKLKNEKNQLVSLNGQSITFDLSIKEI